MPESQQTVIVSNINKLMVTDHHRNMVTIALDKTGRANSSQALGVLTGMCFGGQHRECCDRQLQHS